MPEKINLVYFGRITEEKGIGRCLDFCSVCKKNNLSFNFDIYGDGDIKVFEQKAKNLGISEMVSFKKSIPLKEVIKKMKEYDFLLQLSYHEGMALSVVEAMNIGLVPIVTPVGEIASYSKDGENAIWLDESTDLDYLFLFKKLKNILNDPALYNTLSFAARSTFKNTKKYTEAMIEAIEYL